MEFCGLTPCISSAGRLIANGAAQPFPGEESRQTTSSVPFRVLVQFFPTHTDNRIRVTASEIAQLMYTETIGPSVVLVVWCSIIQEYVVTSVDVIRLLEHVVGNGPFLVAEKGRIRRNLELLQPMTVDADKPDLSVFMEHLTRLRNPRACKINKKIKVYRWLQLPLAVEKVLHKYEFVSGPVPGVLLGSERVPVSEWFPAPDTLPCSESFPLPVPSQNLGPPQTEWNTTWKPQWDPNLHPLFQLPDTSGPHALPPDLATPYLDTDSAQRISPHHPGGNAALGSIHMGTSLPSLDLVSELLNPLAAMPSDSYAKLLALFLVDTYAAPEVLMTPPPDPLFWEEWQDALEDPTQ